MALLNIFKKDKKTEKTKSQDKEEMKNKERAEQKTEVLQPVAKSPKKEGASQAYRILRFPQITEKAAWLAERNQYVFKVLPDANKTEIKKVVENLYGVTVEDVNIINMPGKKRRLGRTQGWREGREKGFKKAIVKIKEGQKIEVLPR